MKKILIGIAIILVALGVLLFSFNKINEQKKLAAIPTPTKAPSYKAKLGMIKNGFSEPLTIVASKKGFFKKNDVEVTIQKIEKGISTALVSKQVDAAIDTPGTFIISRANGEADILEIGEVSYDSPAVFLSYKKPEEIKTIGVSRLGGDHYTRTLQALDVLKIDPKKVRFQIIGSSDNSLLALIEKKVDATSMTTQRWNLFKLRNKPSDEFKVLVDSSKYKEIRNPQILVANADFLKTNANAARALLKSLIEADYWIKNAKAEDVAKLIEGENDLKFEEALIFAKNYKDSMGELKFKPDMTRLSEITKEVEQDIKGKKFDIATFVSSDLINSLEKEGLLK